MNHWKQWWRKQDAQPRRTRQRELVCAGPGCDRPANAKNLCNTHYQRWRKYGDAAVVLRSQHGFVDRNGYRCLTISGRQVREHRLFVERLLGRPLKDHETVHHKNGNRLDNQPHNLELRTSIHPSGQSVEEMLAWCRRYVKTYAPAARKLASARLADQLTLA